MRRDNGRSLACLFWVICGFAFPPVGVILWLLFGALGWIDMDD